MHHSRASPASFSETCSRALVPAANCGPVCRYAPLRPLPARYWTLVATAGRRKSGEQASHGSFYGWLAGVHWLSTQLSRPLRPVYPHSTSAVQLARHPKRRCVAACPRLLPRPSHTAPPTSNQTERTSQPLHLGGPLVFPCPLVERRPKLNKPRPKLVPLFPGPCPQSRPTMHLGWRNLALPSCPDALAALNALHL